MTIKHVNVLLIEDHPLIIEAYKSSLFTVSEEIERIKFTIDIASTCEEAIIKIENHKYDIFFLDINLPPCIKDKLFSGEDIGIFIKSTIPSAKILIITMLNDNYRLYNLMKNIDPDGLMIKNDLSYNDLNNAIKSIISNSPYYSKSILKLLRNNISHDYLLDKIDRQLLYELSLGTKVKELSDILPLSIAGVEKRKRNLKLIFNAEGKTDKDLIVIAKQQGFI